MLVSTSTSAVHAAPPRSSRETALLWVELVAAFVLLPLAIGLWLPPISWVPCLWLIAAVVWQRARTDTGARLAEVRRPFGWDEDKSEVGRMLRRFAVCAAALTLVIIVWSPQRLFDFPRKDPVLWLAIIFLYPLLSVYPQELLYRRYFFQRFRPLFHSPRALTFISAALFAAMHLIFRNSYAVGMTMVGGYFFSDTYRRTGSLRLAAIEHALYGNFVFTIGLGEFIYHGAVKV